MVYDVFRGFSQPFFKNKNETKSVGMLTDALAWLPSDWRSIIGRGKRLFSSTKRRNYSGPTDFF
jgi:hypothetical protein